MSEPSQRHVFRRNHKNDPTVKGCATCGQVIEAGVHEPHVFVPAVSEGGVESAKCDLCHRYRDDGMHAQFSAEVKYLRFERTQETNHDPELLALGIIVTVLDPLDIPQRGRVLTYLNERFG